MKRSPAWRCCWKVSITASMASAISPAAKLGPTTLPPRRGQTGGAIAAAQGQLVPLGAVLVDAEDADVAAVMVAAGVDAAADVQVEVPEVFELIGVLEALGQPAASGIERALASAQKSPPGRRSGRSGARRWAWQTRGTAAWKSSTGRWP